MDTSSTGSRGNTTRRQFVALGSIMLGGTAGCLRLTDEGATSSSTSTVTGTTHSETSTNSSTSPSYPQLELTQVGEIEGGDTLSSPGSKFATVDDSRIVAMGGQAIKIVDVDQVTVEQSIPIPDVANFGAHGIVTDDGSVYAAVGGTVNARVIKIDPESGEVWRFEADAFGPNILRKIGGPVITESVVAVTVATTDNRAGESETRMYLLDAETGDQIVSPDATPGSESLYTTGIAAGSGVVIVSGSDGYYFYDVAAREYVGNAPGYSGEAAIARDGVFYTGKAAYEISTRNRLWENSGSPASLGTILTDDSIYYGTPVSGVTLENGTLRWTFEPDGIVRGIAAAGDGDVWAATDRNSPPGFLYRIDAEDGTILGASTFPRRDGSPISTPYGLFKHGDILFVGAPSSLVAYTIGAEP